MNVPTVPCESCGDSTVSTAEIHGVELCPKCWNQGKRREVMG